MPDRLLLSKFNSRRFERFPKLDGIEPERRLGPNVNIRKFTSLLISLGISPEIRFRASYIYVKVA